MKNTLKSIAYKILKTNLSNYIINLLSPLFLRVPNLKKENKEKKQPFYVVITVDTEPGYIKKSLKRNWMDPSDYKGYYNSIKILRETASKYKAKLTFLLCTHCFAAKDEELKKIIKELKRSHKAKHELGIHLHPKRDLALKNELNQELKYTASKFYNEETIIKLLTTQRNLIKNNLGEKIEKSIISFRWGNWALHPNAAIALEKTSFKIDTTAVPGLRGHTKDDRTYNWTTFKTHYPWFLGYKEKKNKVIEIPVATFKFLGINFRADPFLNSSLLINCFKYYYNNADRSVKPFVFVVMTHSSEAIYENGKKSYVVNNLEQFLKHCSKYKNVQFVTLKEAYNKYIIS